MEQAERVIFREYKNPYMPGVPHYLAVFPDDEANPGRVCCLPFFFDGHGNAVYESYCEASMDYYYKTRLVHRFDAETPKLLNAIQCYYQRPFRIMQKLTH